jgi:hypothetical protein
VEIRPAQWCEGKSAFEGDDLRHARCFGFIGAVSDYHFGPACVWIREAMKNLCDFHVQICLM